MLRRRSDAGFTLVELLVTISILGVVTLAIGAALISFTKNTDATIRQLGESHDAQISAAYFGQDVASMGAREAKAPYAFLQSVSTDPDSRALPCGDTGFSVVRLAWDDSTSVSDSHLVTVAYVVQTVGAERQLHRLVCLGGDTTPMSDTVMAHNLDVGVAPVATCSQPSDCDGAGEHVPESVTMVVSIRNPDDDGPAYVVTLTGQRRQTP